MIQNLKRYNVFGIAQDTRTINRYILLFNNEDNKKKNEVTVTSNRILFGCIQKIWWLYAVASIVRSKRSFVQSVRSLLHLCFTSTSSLHVSKEPPSIYFKLNMLSIFEFVFYYVLYVKSAIQAPYLLFCLDTTFNAQQWILSNFLEEM